MAVVTELSADAPTRFVRLLGEGLVLFRDQRGRVGLLADHCAHRGASLLYGRVEERGIACAYHGWLYDTAGNCLECPAEPAGSLLHLTVKHRAYPVQPHLGLYWAYLGPEPAPLVPSCGVHPDWGILGIEEQIGIRANWLQVMENNLDGAHFPILHQETGGGRWPGVQVESTTRGYIDQCASLDYWEEPWGIMRRYAYHNGRGENDALIFPNIRRHPHDISIKLPVDDHSTRKYVLYLISTFVLIQFLAERAYLPEIGRDPRLRLALFQSLDRQTLRETIYPGFDTAADTFLHPNDPRLPIAGRPFAHHRYDQQAAVRTFEEAGWRRDGSGRFLRENGEPVQLPLRGDVARVTKLAIIADMWRRLGFTVNEEHTPPALALNREYRAHFSGLEWGARGGDTLLQYFLTSQFATPENRFGGANRGSYSNPAFDRLTERLYITVDQTEQARILKDIGEIWTADFPIFPLQYAVFFRAVRQGLFTRGDGNDLAWDTRNAHLWARQ